MEIDTQRVIGEVAAKHGFAIDPNDPIIALATVNGIILESVVREAGEEISTRVREFNKTIDNLERRAGEALGQQTARLITELRIQLGEELQNVARKPETSATVPFPEMIKSSMISLAAGLIAFMLGMLVDRLLK